MAKIETCLSPALLQLYDFSKSIVVVIDIFRATSTIAAALHNGATRIIPVDKVGDCIAIGNNIAGSITAGERDGKVMPGLQHGNSPSEYPSEFIKNKTLVLTTTNGTRLLHMAKDSQQIISGSFLNLGAVCNYLLAQNCDVLLACASWKDKFNIEDTLFAGAVAKALENKFETNCDSTRSAKILWQAAENNLSEFIKDTSHYKRLSAYGLQEDMEYCCQINKHDALVVYQNGELVIPL
jgi:2-phosphosulfolactate phosphatase